MSEFCASAACEEGGGAEGEEAEGGGLGDIEAEQF